MCALISTSLDDSVLILMILILQCKIHEFDWEV
jgi:hypothetical protein